MKPILSIVVPVFNRAEIVARTLDSILSQAVVPLHLILVDNNSSDSSFQVLNRWKAEHESDKFIIEVIEEKRPGASAARNAGLDLVNTEWTLFFDSDDIMLPGHLLKVVTAIRQHPEADVIGWNTAFISRDGKHDRLYIFSDKEFEFFNIFKSMFGTQRYAARTEIFRKAGKWDTRFGMADDIELGQRIIALSPNIAYLKGEPTVSVMETDNSIVTSANILFKKYVASMESIKYHTPENKRHWVDLQIILMARTWARSSNEAAEIAESIIRHTPMRRRWLWRFFDLYTRIGGRGVARIYFPIRNLI